MGDRQTRTGGAKKKARAASPAASRATSARTDPGPRVARAALALALVGTALAVDTTADNAFDAPKRLLALLGIGVAALAAFGGRAPNPSAVSRLRQGPKLQKVILGLAVAAAAAAGLAALLSPRRAVAVESYRTVLLFALLLPLGASRALDRPRSLLACFLGACAVNAAVSMLQASGTFTPFTLRAWGGREATGAFAGNVGYLAIALAIAAVASLGILFVSRTRAARILAGGIALFFTAGVVVNQNLTSLTALAAGGAGAAFLRFGRRAWLGVPVLLAALASGVFLYRPLQSRAAEAASAVRAGDWDRVLTYRIGPWAAAAEMTRDRPLTGWGPGTFGQEFVSHRLEAEIKARRRFVNPLVTSSYAEAHSDYLQPFAEAGVAAGAAAAGAALLLIVSVCAAARRLEGERRAEAVVLVAILIAGATAALTWFPLQRPVTALPLLLAAGRGWKLTEEEPA